jgi:hypothetical protein
VVVGVGTVVATTELVLQDGRVLGGVDVRRDGVDYVVTLESGDVIVIPTALVETVRLANPPETDRRSRADSRRDTPGQVGGSPPPDGPSGIRTGAPETLAGAPARLPKTAEQLEVFGEPARFQKNIIDNRWRPESAFDLTEDVLADSRSTWAEDIVDNEWVPESAFGADKDVLANSRSTWRKSIIDNEWTPTDAFAR